jgi:pyruvate dehydrogenase E1 component beta subunit
MASVVERILPTALKKPPIRITLPFSPAPTSIVLEKVYYPTEAMVVSKALHLMDKAC